jgi:hypothetical protein
MAPTAAQGQGKHEALRGVKEWVIRHPLVGGQQGTEPGGSSRSCVRGFRDLFQGTSRSGKNGINVRSRDSDRILIRQGSHALGAIVPICRRAQGFARANTLQQFELNPALQQAVKGQVLWVDEAGFLSVHQMLKLQEFAIEHNCRLIVTGDTKRHHSVQWGDGLRILERSGVIAQAELTKLHRQRIPELRAAIEDLSKGRTGEGFDKLDKFGAIQEIADAADRLAADDADVDGCHSIVRYSFPDVSVAVARGASGPAWLKKTSVRNGRALRRFGSVPRSIKGRIENRFGWLRHACFWLVLWVCPVGLKARMRHPSEEWRIRKFAPKYDKNYSFLDYAKSV